MLEGFTLTVVAFAGIMRGITGFGGAMLMTPALGLIGSSGQTVLVVLILEAAAALVMIPEVYPDIRITQLALLAIPACLTVPVGNLLLAFLDPSSSRRLIGISVICFGLILMSGFRYPRSPGRWFTAALGAFSGVCLGATSIGAPPVILFLLSGPDPARVTRATLTAFITITSLVGVTGLVLIGGFVVPGWWWIAALTVTYLASTLIGMSVFKGLNERTARLTALWLIIAVGAIATLLA